MSSVNDDHRGDGSSVAIMSIVAGVGLLTCGDIFAKIVTEDDLKAIDKEIKGQVAAAAEFAQTSPEPDLSELMTDIYVDAPESAAQA